MQVPGARDVAVEFFTMSKSYNMAGWRVGFMVGNRDLVDALARIKSYHDYGTFTPIQVAAIVALEGPQDCVAEIALKYQKRRDVLVKGLHEAGWMVDNPKASMYVWAKIPDAYAAAGSLEFTKKLLARGQGRGVARRRLRRVRRRPRALRADRERGPHPAGGARRQGDVPPRRSGGGRMTMLKTIRKSAKLANVCYDIRGPVLARAKLMEEEGHRIIKLNIGNLAPFGFDTPDEVRHDVIVNLPQASGYSDSKGLFAARKAIMHYTQEKGIAGVELDDIFVGNGVSELIVMAMQGLLDDDDEVLVPAPDYPLWTAAVSLAGGRARHYLCDEGAGWLPDLADMESKITERTRAIVIINPNNPTGALYPPDLLREIVGIARRHQLIVFADEIYDKTLYDGATHTSIAALADDVLFVTFNGLSKNYRACGYRSGWMVDLRREAPRAGLPRGAEHPRLDAPVRERARPVRDPDRAGRLPEHQRPGRAGRPARPAARPGVRPRHLDPRRDLRQAEGGALPLPAARSGPLSDPGRPAVRAGTARGGEGAGRAGQRLQLAAPRPLPRRVPAEQRRPDRRHGPHRPLSRRLPAPPRPR